jgi:hypothetical protein
MSYPFIATLFIALAVERAYGDAIHLPKLLSLGESTVYIHEVKICQQNVPLRHTTEFITIN